VVKDSGRRLRAEIARIPVRGRLFFVDVIGISILFV
jgi:hypothetical protein